MKAMDKKQLAEIVEKESNKYWRNRSLKRALDGQKNLQNPLERRENSIEEVEVQRKQKTVHRNCRNR